MEIRRIHPISLTIIIGTLFARMATFMTIPFLAIYLTSAKGVSPGYAGAIIGVSSIVGLFGSFVGGYLSDLYGQEKVMKYSIFIWIFVFVGFALADSVMMFFILNALNGLCRSFFEPSSRALLSKVTKPKNKLLVFNLRYAAINVGAAVGPLIGLKIGSSSSTSAFFVTAVVYTVYFIVLIAMFSLHSTNNSSDSSSNERVTMAKALRVLSTDRVFLFAVIGLMVGVCGYSQFSSTIPQYLAHSPFFQNGVEVYSYLIVFNAVTVLIVQYPVTRIGKRYSALISIMIGTLTTSIGLLGFAFFTSVPLLFLSIFVFTVGEVMMFTMTDLFVDQISPHDMKGLYFGAMGFTAIGGSFGPWIGGLMLEYFGYTNNFALFSVLTLFPLLGFPVLLYVKTLMTSTKRKVEFSL
ncbi:MDR family MFS transporter [Bacillus solimangrovi]|uniref:Transporter n=1 Tax=Bacillus solimangrovi TaxID=1305675 RepID=A0A1E5LFC1_9BACI|nr:MFS transporter [Bacillus solimangrovi]OEH92785.1 transporter [Bacillus solimangrovi]